MIFHVFACQEEREDGTRCQWPLRVGERRVPMGTGGVRAREISDFCKRCRRQGRAEEGEQCDFALVRYETKNRKVVEFSSLAF